MRAAHSREPFTSSATCSLLTRGRSRPDWRYNTAPTVLRWGPLPLRPRLPSRSSPALARKRRKWTCALPFRRNSRRNNERTLSARADEHVDPVVGPFVFGAPQGADVDAVRRNAVVDQNLAHRERALEREPVCIGGFVARS